MAWMCWAYGASRQRCTSSNVLSMNSLRRNGFRQEGVLRQAGFDGERYWDLVIFGILRDEIEAQRQKDKVHLPLEPSEGNGREPA